MSRSESYLPGRDVIAEVAKYDLDHFADDSFLNRDLSPEAMIDDLPSSPSRQRGYKTTATASLVRRDLVESAEPFLTPEQEITLSWKMNYCKWKADTLRSEMQTTLDLSARQALANQVKAYWEAGLAIRNHIARANYPRILAAARDVGFREESLGEFVSHAGELLLSALDRYDFRRNIRLSTWLQDPLYVWAAMEMTKDRRRKGRAGKTNMAFWELEEAAGQTLPDVSFDDEDSRHFLGMVLIELFEEAGLDAREKKILALRHDLASGTELTLVQIGEKLGLTKQRILQILKKAVKKIQTVKRSGPISGAGF